MGKRLSKIYTRTGDDGTTGLGDGTRTLKESARIEAIGEVDELNSCLGVLLAEDLEAEMRTKLEDIQHDLFDLGGDLSIPGRASMNQVQVVRLEKQLDDYNNGLPSLKEFILPGGIRAASLCHVARAVSKRALSRRNFLRAGAVSAASAGWPGRLRPTPGAGRPDRDGRTRRDRSCRSSRSCGCRAR